MYGHQKIEHILFKYSKVIDKVQISINPDLTSIYINVLKGFKSSDLKEFLIKSNDEFDEIPNIND